MRKIKALFAIVGVSLGLFLVPTPASAGPATYYFGAYDFRYEEPYSCGSTSGTCWYTYRNLDSMAYVSYYNSQALYGSSIRDYLGGRLNSWGSVLVAGQGVRIMCWKASSTGEIWLTLASAQYEPNEGNRVFAIGWVQDSKIILSRADRLAYVPECGGVLT